MKDRIQEVIDDIDAFRASFGLFTATPEEVMEKTTKWEKELREILDLDVSGDNK